MKKIFVLFVLGFILYGCGCLAQIPPQYVYNDENCVATLPDYSGLVITSDNCELVDITQIPAPGIQIMVTTVIEMRAIDATGNTSSAYFNAVLLDTIPPSIQLNPAWTGYTEQEVGDMYKTFYGFIQKKGVELNDLYAGNPYIMDLWDGRDTLLYTDTLKVFNNTIPIPDHVSGEEWWTAGGQVQYYFTYPTKMFVNN